MTREEAFEQLESIVGRYILREDNESRFVDIAEWRAILSALKGETNTTNLTADDWSSDEIKVLKFMVRCAYNMIDCVNADCLGDLNDFDRNSMYDLCCKLGIEDVV